MVVGLVRNQALAPNQSFLVCTPIPTLIDQDINVHAPRLTGSKREEEKKKKKLAVQHCVHGISV